MQETKVARPSKAFGQHMLHHQAQKLRAIHCASGRAFGFSVAPTVGDVVHIAAQDDQPLVNRTCFSVAASGIISFLTGFVYLSQSGLVQVKPLKAYGRFSNAADISTHAA